METIVSGIAHYYSGNLAREVVKGLKENTIKGVYNGGMIPFGYRQVDRINRQTGQRATSNRGVDLHDIAIYEPEAEGVRIMYKRILEGKQLRDIIDELTSKGIYTKSRIVKRGKHKGREYGGVPFTNSSIENILRCKKYCGYTFINISKTGEVRKFIPNDLIMRL
jgi:site-specific DNA recombinase